MITMNKIGNHSHTHTHTHTHTHNVSNIKSKLGMRETHLKKKDQNSF